MKTSLKLSYLLMAVVLVGALVAGTRSTGSRDPATREQAIATTIKCPTCRGQSVAESDAPASKAIREDIAKRVAAGESDAEIRDYYAHQYGDDILLKPASSGLAGLVWVLPVAAVVLASVGLFFVFRRWRRWSAPA